MKRRLSRFGRPLLPRAILLVLVLPPSSLRAQDTYEIGYSRYRDISSIEQGLSVKRTWAERLQLSLGGTNSGDYNETLDRFRDSRGGEFELCLQISKALKTYLSGKGTKTRDEGTDYRNQTLENQLSLGFSYSPLRYLSLATSIGPILDQYERRDLSTDVGTSIINRGVRDYLLIALEEGGSCARYLQTGKSGGMTSSRNRELGCGAKGRMLDWLEGEAEVRGAAIVEDYPTLEGKERKDSKRGLGRLSLLVQLPPRLKLGLGTILEAEGHNYLSPENPQADEKGRKIKKSGIVGNVAYSLREGTEVNLNLGRSFRNRDYRQDRSDEDLDEKSFEGSIEYRLEGGSSLRFERGIKLTSYDFPHKYNFDDRDILDQKMALQTNLPLPGTTSLSTRISTQDNSIIYLDGESSANNRRLAVYEFANLVSFSPGQATHLENTLGLRANYTTYRFNPERNTLVRSVRLGGKLSYSPRAGYPYQGDYLLTLEDRGAYLFNTGVGGWRYRKETQIWRHELSLSLPLVNGESFSVVPSYRLKAIETFAYLTEREKIEKGRDYEHHLGTSSTMRLSNASVFHVSAERVTREENPFWDLKVLLTYNL